MANGFSFFSNESTKSVESYVSWLNYPLCIYMYVYILDKFDDYRSYLIIYLKLNHRVVLKVSSLNIQISKQCFLSLCKAEYLQFVMLNTVNSFVLPFRLVGFICLLCYDLCILLVLFIPLCG